MPRKKAPSKIEKPPRRVAAAIHPGAQAVSIVHGEAVPSCSADEVDNNKYSSTSKSAGTKQKVSVVATALEDEMETSVDNTSPSRPVQQNVMCIPAVDFGPGAYTIAESTEEQLRSTYDELMQAKRLPPVTAPEPVEDDDEENDDEPPSTSLERHERCGRKRFRVLFNILF